MTDQLTDNEVIARFMGIMIFNTYAEMQAVPLAVLKPWALPHQLKYHEKWDELMPVWYKFKDLTMGKPENLKQLTRHCGNIEHAILHEGVSEACKLLAEGIRWYNSVKK